MALSSENSPSSPSLSTELRRTQSIQPPSAVSLEHRAHWHTLSRTRSIPTRLPENNAPIVFDRPSVNVVRDVPVERPFSPRPPSSVVTLGSDWVMANTTTGAQPAVNPRPSTGPYPRRPPSLYHRTVGYLGYGTLGSKARRLFVHTIWVLVCSVIQIIAIIVVLILSSVINSPTLPNIKQWNSCTHPLRGWPIIWIFMSFLLSGLQYWNFIRERKPRARRDAELGTVSIAPTSPNERPQATTDNANTSSTTTGQPAANARPPLPHSAMFARLNLFQNVLAITWFITAHILVYGSLNTCRFSSPIIWWLNIALLCIMYVTVVEIILLGLAVLIVLPLVFLFWNIVLFLTGNHPLQNPIRPEIGKLPKSVVDRIPLVLYIPAPEAADGVVEPPVAYSYPPRPTKNIAPSRKKRFRFLKKVKFSKKEQEAGASGSNKDKETPEAGQEKKDAVWEDLWEIGDYPFVRLDENRATCAICLGDFEAPKKIGGVAELPKMDTAVGPSAAEASSSSTETQQMVVVEHPTEVEVEEQLKLEDAGEGPQPLRLLECGHAFHQTCLDPWLINTSGRCPLCQKPVELPPPQNKKKQQRWTTRRNVGN